jgi:flagellin
MRSGASTLDTSAMVVPAKGVWLRMSVTPNHGLHPDQRGLGLKHLGLDAPKRGVGRGPHGQHHAHLTLGLGAVDAALGQISDMRSNLGAIQNRLQSAIENLTTTSNNMQQSVSRIADTDYGTATTQMSRAQIINQAATAMLAQANQQSQLVLQLLK